MDPHERTTMISEIASQVASQIASSHAAAIPVTKTRWDKAWDLFMQFPILAVLAFFAWRLPEINSVIASGYQKNAETLHRIVEIQQKSHEDRLQAMRDDVALSRQQLREEMARYNTLVMTMVRQIDQTAEENRASISDTRTQVRELQQTIQNGGDTHGDPEAPGEGS